MNERIRNTLKTLGLLLVLFLMWCVFVDCVSETPRTWSYATSPTTITATFRGVIHDEPGVIYDRVKLRKQDGKTKVIGMTYLSQLDQEWIENRRRMLAIQWCLLVLTMIILFVIGFIYHKSHPFQKTTPKNLDPADFQGG